MNTVLQAREKFKNRPLIINDLDFSDLNDPERDNDPLRVMPAAQLNGCDYGAPPPPPPPLGM